MRKNTGVEMAVVGKRLRASPNVGGCGNNVQLYSVSVNNDRVHRFTLTRSTFIRHHASQAPHCTAPTTLDLTQAYPVLIA